MCRVQMKCVLALFVTSCGLLGVFLESSSEQTIERPSRVVKLTKEYFVAKWVGGNDHYWYRLEMKGEGSAVFGSVYLYDEPDIYAIEHWELPKDEPITMEAKPNRTGDEVLQLTVSYGLGGIHLLVFGRQWKEEAVLFPAQRVEEAQCKLKRAFESLDKACTKRGIAHVCLGAKDLAATRKFYCEGLGFSKQFDFIRNGEVVGFYLKVAEGNFIEVFRQDEIHAHAGCPIIHICFEVDDVDAVAARLKSLGYEATEKHLGQDKSWQAWTTDPAGVRIEFHQYTPESTQLTGLDCTLD